MGMKWNLFMSIFLVHVTLGDNASQLETLLKKLDGLSNYSQSFDCLTFNEANAYWTYEICPFRSAVQFHAHGRKTRIQEVKLGSKVHLKIPIEASWNAKGEARIVYTYDAGDPCTIEQDSKPARSAIRFMDVTYSCCQHRGDLRNYILSVTEPIMCQYSATVCLAFMCKIFATENITELVPAKTKVDLEPPPVEKPYNAAPTPSPTVATRTRSPAQELLLLTKKVFNNGFGQYMKNAFPMDELRPLTCTGSDFEMTAGNMLTLVDSLDTLAVLGMKEEFKRAVVVVTEQLSFDVDKTANVFETTIRILGGLLSAHMLVMDDVLDLRPVKYNGGLLRLAVDLGDRLLPAFKTPTSIPYGTVHLQKGVPVGETTEACTSAAGSLLLEFGMLSVLTGNSTYGSAARSALQAIFDLRSKLDLVGRHIDVKTGRWTEAIAGIGSNIDSLYEYYLKCYILFGDEGMWKMFRVLYSGAITHLREKTDDTWYLEVDMNSDHVSRRYFSSLQAFWPGLQSILGDIASSTRTLNAFLQVWNDFGGVPEDFDFERWTPLRGGSHSSYPLRPEVIESIYFVYSVTRDASWVAAGEDFIRSVERRCATKCGYASLYDVSTDAQVDNMPSYFLGETIKYLYLLFSEAAANSDCEKDCPEPSFLSTGNYVFSTEAHPFKVSFETQRIARELFVPRNPKITDLPVGSPLWGVPSLRRDYQEECPTGNEDDVGFVEKYYKAIGNELGRFPIRNRIANNRATDSLETLKPEKDVVKALSDAILTAAGKLLGVPEDKSISAFLPKVGNFKILPYISGFSVTHVETGDTIEMSNLGAAITSVVTTFTGSSGTQVPFHMHLEQNSKFAYHCEVHYVLGTKSEMLHHWRMHFNTIYNPILNRDEDTCSNNSIFAKDEKIEHTIQCSTSFFGPTLRYLHEHGGIGPYEIVFPESDTGCSPQTTKPGQMTNKIVFANRGKCLFEDKARFALNEGAKGLLVGLVESGPLFIMSGRQGENRDDQSFIPSFMIGYEDANRLRSEIIDNHVKSISHENPSSMWVKINIPVTSTTDLQKPWAMATDDGIIAYVGNHVKWAAKVTKDPAANQWQLSLVNLFPK